MDPGALLVTELRADGMTVELEGEQIVITPRNRITEQLRRRIRYRRSEAIAYLELEQRIHAMARRWEYSAVELAETLEKAGADPAGIRIVVERDEART